MATMPTITQTIIIAEVGVRAEVGAEVGVLAGEEEEVRAEVGLIGELN